MGAPAGARSKRVKMMRNVVLNMIEERDERAR